MVFVQKHSKVCIGCGVSFRGEHLARRKYCSSKCASANNANHNSKALKLSVYRCTKICERCGKPFDVVHARENRRRFCSLACRGAWQSSLPADQWKDKISANTANRPRGADNPAWGKAPSHGHWHAYARKDGTVVKLRSSWELAVATFLDAAGIAWEYEPRRFTLADRTYLPDFWLPTMGVFWEVKGWMHARHEETIRQFRAMQPIPLIVIGPSVIRGIAHAANVKVRL